MTSQSGVPRRGRLLPTVPKGDVLGGFDSYEEAQAVVDRLVKAEFPVKHISIVGSDLRSVERVTGSMSYGRAALAGAASGAWLGLFFGLLLFIFTPTPNAVLYIGAAVLIGAGFGMMFGLVSYSMNRRRRDFTSTNQVVANRYEVIVDPAFTIRAQELLTRSAQ